MTDDPFDDSDQEKTRIRVPQPGRGRPPGPTELRPAPEPVMNEGPEPVDLGMLAGLNPLVAAANTLLGAVPRIRNSVMHADPSALRASLLQQIAAFERTLQSRGTAPETSLIARYALCTLLDEAVSRTPWGGTADWAQNSLLVTLHREVSGGEKFFQLLGRMSDDPARNIDLLELFYVCLALGFEGQFRVVEGGKAKVDTVRERLAILIRKQRGDYERDLSGQWRGEQTVARKGLSLTPLWVSMAVTAAVLAGIYLLLTFALSGSTDAVAFSQIKAPTTLPPRAAPSKPAAPPRLAQFLAQDIQEGRVVVEDTGTESHVTIRGDGMFDSGSATLKPEFEPLIFRIAAALDDVHGSIRITGHTDDVPSRSLRFPSNWHLSQGRADNIAKFIAGRLKDPTRVKAEGKGDAEPVAPNDTPQNRALNRRIEIIVPFVS
ncbi:MAG: type IVB secretion system protein IcmH/DotU [Burkholderiales bacterium]